MEVSRAVRRCPPDRYEWARCLACVDEVSMSTAEYSRKLDELDRLLNDPDVPMQPNRIWSLLADVSRPDVASTRPPGELPDGRCGFARSAQR
jgi:hypothetical protein